MKKNKYILLEKLLENVLQESGVVLESAKKLPAVKKNALPATTKKHKGTPPAKVPIGTNFFSKEELKKFWEKRKVPILSFLGGMTTARAFFPKKEKVPYPVRVDENQPNQGRGNYPVGKILAVGVPLLGSMYIIKRLLDERNRIKREREAEEDKTL